MQVRIYNCVQPESLDILKEFIFMDSRDGNNEHHDDETQSFSTSKYTKSFDDETKADEDSRTTEHDDITTAKTESSSYYHYSDSDDLKKIDPVSTLGNAIQDVIHAVQDIRVIVQGVGQVIEEGKCFAPIPAPKGGRRLLRKHVLEHPDEKNVSFKSKVSLEDVKYVLRDDEDVSVITWTTFGQKFPDDDFEEVEEEEHLNARPISEDNSSGGKSQSTGDGSGGTAKATNTFAKIPSSFVTEDIQPEDLTEKNDTIPANRTTSSLEENPKESILLPQRFRNLPDKKILILKRLQCRKAGPSGAGIQSDFSSNSEDNYENNDQETENLVPTKSTMKGLVAKHRKRWKQLRTLRKRIVKMNVKLN